ncbi:MAG: CPBP family intramembrane glutamic endopeptidase, partial [Candidatus Geothermincolia bacterium]
GRLLWEGCARRSGGRFFCLDHVAVAGGSALPQPDTAAPYSPPRPPGLPPPPLPPAPGVPGSPPSYAADGWRARLQVNWSPREAMGVLALVFAVYWISSVPAAFFAGDAFPVLPWLIYLGVFATGILAGAAWITRRHGQGAASLGLTKRRAGRNAALGLLGGIVGLIANVIIAAFVTLLLDALRVEAERPEQVTVAGVPAWQLVITILVVVLIAPIVEEILFRGILYPALRKRSGIGAAVLASSVLFAVLHLNWIAFLPLTAVGVVLALLYEWRGSLVAPIVAHAVNNGIVMAVALLLA